jgi:ankyrin repeat protein
MARGARVDHISAKGWTPAFNLFGYKWIHNTHGSCVEYLELLSSATFSEFDIQDIDGWSAMHRAAAFGTSEDIAALKKRGSSVTSLTHLDWAPIRCAVRFENVDTFSELVKHLQPSFVGEKDVRGWTLLHEAASMGSSTMLHLILQHGADPHIVSNATSYVVPTGLENRAVTPADIAKNEGDDTYKIYVEALKKAGFDITIPEQVDEEDTYDVFWLAEPEETHIQEVKD